MLHYLLWLLLVVPQLLHSEGVRASLPHDGSIDDCLTNSLDNSIYCRGARALRNVIKNLNKNEKPLVLIRGLEIVPSKDDNKTSLPSSSPSPSKSPSSLSADPVAHDAVAVNARVGAESADADAVADDSFLALFAAYLRTHELNLKFSDLLADESERYLAQDFERNGVKVGSATDGIEEARKKDKGQGIILAMALMFGKMMAVLGLGGIGGLALKALGVAMAALMMTAIVGLKALSQHGHENTHSISYLTAEGHHHKRRRRRRRNVQSEIYDPLPLVYQAWPQPTANDI